MGNRGTPGCGVLSRNALPDDLIVVEGFEYFLNSRATLVVDSAGVALLVLPQHHTGSHNSVRSSSMVASS